MDNSPKKKIAVISGLFGLVGVGGAELQLYYLSCQFAKRGHDVNVITSHESTATESEMSLKGIKLHLISSKPLHTSRFKIDFYWKAWRMLCRIEPDVCLVRTAPLAPLCLLYATMHKARFIYSVTHDKDCSAARITSLKAVARRIFQFAIKRADVVVSQTNDQRYSLLRDFGKPNVVVRNGHEVPVDDHQKTNPPIIFWLANLRLEKRIDLFLQLAKNLEGCNCAFAVAGNPMDAGCFETLQESAKGLPSLAYYGALPHAQAMGLLGKASILVNTSDNEGFPNTFVEAWMRRTPVATLSIDPDNLIKQLKLGICSNTIENMEHQIRLLLSSTDLLAEMGENARNYAVANHSLEKVASEYERLLYDVPVKTNIKIAIITGLFGYMSVGGAETQLYYLAREFVKMGYEVHVITSNRNEFDPSLIRAEGMILHFVDCEPLHKSRWKVDFYVKAWMQLRKIRPHVCLVKTIVLAPLGAFYAKLHGGKFIYSANSDKDFRRKQITGVTAFFKAIVRGVSQCSLKWGYVIAQTELQRKQFRENLGVETSVVREGQPLPVGESRKSETPLILWLANLRKEKRLDLFLELVKRFKEDSCVFAVAGRPIDQGCLNLLQLGLKQNANLVYYGPLPAEEAVDLVAKARILINTSDYEGFPNTFIEAWMRGTPTVSLNFDPDDLIKSHRMGFHSGTLDQMEIDIRHLLVNPDIYQEFSENARNYALGTHGIENAARSYAEFFSSQHMFSELKID